MLGTLRLPLILVAAGNPAAAAGTNIAISAASAASGGCRHAGRRGSTGAFVGWMAPPSVAGTVGVGLLGHRVPEAVLYAALAAVLAWSGADLLARPMRERPAARPRLARAVAFGAVIGLAGGVLGVILGTLRMPALLRGVGLDARRAAGTNLVVGFALGSFGFAAHAARMEVDWGALAAGVPGAPAGGWLGARWTGRASELALRRGIGAALLAVALAFAVESALV